MKIVFTIDYSIDGEIPSSIDIGEAIGSVLPSMITSENFDGTDNWAILFDSVSWENSQEVSK